MPVGHAVPLAVRIRTRAVAVEILKVRQKFRKNVGVYPRSETDNGR